MEPWPAEDCAARAPSAAAKMFANGTVRHGDDGTGWTVDVIDGFAVWTSCDGLFRQKPAKHPRRIAPSSSSGSEMAIPVSARPNSAPAPESAHEAAHDVVGSDATGVPPTEASLAVHARTHDHQRKSKEQKVIANLHALANELLDQSNHAASATVAEGAVVATTLLGRVAQLEAEVAQWQAAAV